MRLSEEAAEQQHAADGDAEREADEGDMRISFNRTPWGLGAGLVRSHVCRLRGGRNMVTWRIIANVIVVLVVSLLLFMALPSAPYSEASYTVGAENSASYPGHSN